MAGNGLTEGVLGELERALNHHELIKVQIKLEDREQRAEVIAELCKAGRAELVQTIGKMALLYRRNPQPNKQLSNIHRYK
ncbi:RNA-binding protein [compost metagenome]